MAKEKKKQDKSGFDSYERAANEDVKKENPQIGEKESLQSAIEQIEGLEKRLAILDGESSGPFGMDEIDTGPRKSDEIIIGKTDKNEDKPVDEISDEKIQDEKIIIPDEDEIVPIEEEDDSKDNISFEDDPPIEENLTPDQEEVEENQDKESSQKDEDRSIQDDSSSQPDKDDEDGDVNALLEAIRQASQEDEKLDDGGSDVFTLDGVEKQDEEEGSKNIDFSGEKESGDDQSSDNQSSDDNKISLDVSESVDDKNESGSDVFTLDTGESSEEQDGQSSENKDDSNDEGSDVFTLDMPDEENEDKDDNNIDFSGGEESVDNQSGEKQEKDAIDGMSSIIMDDVSFTASEKTESEPSLKSDDDALTSSDEVINFDDNEDDKGITFMIPDKNDEEEISQKEEKTDPSMLDDSSLFSRSIFAPLFKFLFKDKSEQNIDEEEESGPSDLPELTMGGSDGMDIPLAPGTNDDEKDDEESNDIFNLGKTELMPDDDGVMDFSNMEEKEDEDVHSFLFGEDGEENNSEEEDDQSVDIESMIRESEKEADDMSEENKMNDETSAQTAKSNPTENEDAFNELFAGKDESEEKPDQQDKNTDEQDEKPDQQDENADEQDKNVDEQNDNIAKPDDSEKLDDMSSELNEEADMNASEELVDESADDNMQEEDMMNEDLEEKEDKKADQGKSRKPSRMKKFLLPGLAALGVILILGLAGLAFMMGLFPTGSNQNQEPVSVIPETSFDANQDGGDIVNDTNSGESSPSDVAILPVAGDESEDDILSDELNLDTISSPKDESGEKKISLSDLLRKSREDKDSKENEESDEFQDEPSPALLIEEEDSGGVETENEVENSLEGDNLNEEDLSEEELSDITSEANDGLDEIFNESENEAENILADLDSIGDISEKGSDESDISNEESDSSLPISEEDEQNESGLSTDESDSSFQSPIFVENSESSEISEDEIFSGENENLGQNEISDELAAISQLEGLISLTGDQEDNNQNDNLLLQSENRLNEVEKKIDSLLLNANNINEEFARVNTLILGVMERNKTILDRVQSNETSLSLIFEILTEFENVSTSLNETHIVLLDLIARIDLLESNNPADEDTVNKALSDIHSELKLLTSNLAILARLTLGQGGIEGATAPGSSSDNDVRSSISTMPSNGRDVVYEEERHQGKNTDIVSTLPDVDIPPDIKVNDHVEGYGYVKEIVPTGDNGEKLLIMEHGSLIINTNIE